MVNTKSSSLTWLFALQAAAAPAFAPNLASAAPAFVPNLASSLHDIFSSLNGSDLSQTQQVLENIVPLPAPTSAQEAATRLQEAYAVSKPTGYFQSAALILKQGLAGSDFKSLAAAFNKQPGGENSAVNNNPRKPRKSIYPKKSPADGTYKQTEKQMREQIYIPPTFTYGEKPPVILVPGTGARGSENFVGNLIPILQGQPYADIVWINPPGFQLADAQSNAETVAYAINYISGISKNKKVNLIGWSQASLDMQWALKYWPSARSITLNQIAISADYAGTSLANLIDPNGAVPYPPSIIQQQATSNFVRTLRSGIGSSALVPTTTLYSGNFDEIVEPQQGTTASAYLDNGNGIPVTNNEVQLVCPKGSPGAGFFTHESMMSHPLTYALIEDVLKNGGPGQPSRLNLDTVCAGTLAGPLTDADLLLTEATIPLAGLQVLLYHPKTTVEPPIRAYAR